MLEMRLFRDSPEMIRADHDRRSLPHDMIDQVIALDSRWKDLRYQADQLRKKRNDSARGIAAAKKSGNKEEAERILAEVADIGAEIERLGNEADDAENERDRVRMRIPNIMHESVPIGDDDTKNIERSLHGVMPEFDFEPKVHNDLIEENAWVDLGRAAKIAGSRFYYLKGDLARLEMALQQHTIDFIMRFGPI